MKLHSTRDPNHLVGLRDAVLQSLPKDGGLYVPAVIPTFSASELQDLASLDFTNLAFRVALKLFEDELPKSVLEDIINTSMNFPVPLVHLSGSVSILELFHGPSLAFKDFGARFMAGLMGYFVRNSDQKLTILVATSGDTGGAVAAGFHNTPGVEVIILYPSGRVSFLQEQQLTTLGGNIFACEIKGSFDDCQALVKQAFLDQSLRDLYWLSSANSINIARLIPQSFYYFHGFFQTSSHKVCFSVPSGNFGNLTAGLLAKKMGLPITGFIASTNRNDVVPDYLKRRIYQPKSSLSTISNAMDVGAPSNFDRMMHFYGSTWNKIIKDVSGYSFTDKETKSGIKELHSAHNYTSEPHTAIGYLGALAHHQVHPDDKVISLATAHPAKFKEVVDPLITTPVHIPPRLARLAHEEKTAVRLDSNYSSFLSYLLDRRHN